MTQNTNFFATDSLFTFVNNTIQAVSLTGLPAKIKIYSIKFKTGYWYLATSKGMYVTSDEVKWHRLQGNSYPSGLHVDKIINLGDQVFLGTYGAGIWKFQHPRLSLGDDFEICEGQDVQISASGIDSNITWCCGLGTGDTATFTASVSTNISASTQDVFGITLFDTVHVTVNPKPVASFGILNNSQCFSGNKFNFANTSTNGIIYLWDFGDNTTSYDQPPIHSYTSYADSFVVNLIVESTKGCLDTAFHYTRFKESPEAYITLAGDSMICDGDSISLYANAGNNYTYRWFKNNNLLAGETQSFLITKESGSYTVEVTNLNNCSEVSFPVTLTVLSSDFGLNFTGSPRNPTYDAPTQQFNSVAFTNLTLGTGNYDFTWLFGNGNTSVISDPFYNYKYNGLYSVSLTAIHKTTGCRDTFTRVDYIQCQGGSQNPCPLSVQLSAASSTVICRGDSVLINSTTTGNIILYQWSRNGTILNDEDTSFIYAKESGEYRLIISDTSCSVSSLPLYVTQFPTVDPLIHAAGKIQPCTSDSLRLYLKSAYPKYLWSTNQNTADIWVKNSGSYSVIVKDAFGCWIQSDPYTVNASILDAPQICIVTVDTNTGENLVAWERPNSQSILGYNVYKETFQANIYQIITFVPYDSLSVFIDTASNPRVRANRYKISLVDTCNTESALSDHHKTIHLSASTGTSGENNLNWSHYEGFEFSFYKIYRGTTPYNLQLMDSIPSNLNSYSDINPPSGLVYYQVTVVKNDTCYPAIIRAQTTSGPFSQSVSNLKDYNATTSDYLVVSKDTVNFDTNGGNKNLDIFTNLTTWSVASSDSWLTASTNTTTRKLSLTASANTSGILRSAVVTLSATGIQDVIVYVIQAGTVGFPENMEFNKPIMYPNPFGNELHIIIPKNQETRSVQIIDMYGKTVRIFENNIPAHIVIDRHSMAKGVYLVRIEGESLFVQKVFAK